MIVGILTIATGKYKRFVKPLYDSIVRNFLPSHQKLFVLFTDEVDQMQKELQSFETEIFEIKRRGFPGDTLYRYHHFFSSKERLLARGEKCPHVLYYLDADMLVLNEVGEEILPVGFKNLIATAHPGFFQRQGHNPLGTPETNPLSKAFIPPERYRPCYWAGGFNGGKFDDFMILSNSISDRIDEDDRNGLVAIWHDESHLNAYLSESNVIDRVKTMNPSYCYPESWKLPFEKKILALDKNHAEMRSEH